MIQGTTTSPYTKQSWPLRFGSEMKCTIWTCTQVTEHCSCDPHKQDPTGSEWEWLYEGSCSTIYESQFTEMHKSGHIAHSPMIHIGSANEWNYEGSCSTIHSYRMLRLHSTTWEFVRSRPAPNSSKNTAMRLRSTNNNLWGITQPALDSRMPRWPWGFSWGTSHRYMRSYEAPSNLYMRSEELWGPSNLYQHNWTDTSIQGNLPQSNIKVTQPQKILHSNTEMNSWGARPANEFRK